MGLRTLGLLPRRRSRQELQAKDALRRHLSDAARTVLHATAAMRSAALAMAADGGASMGQRYYQRQEAVLADMLVTLYEVLTSVGAAPGWAPPGTNPAPAGGRAGGGTACEAPARGGAEASAAAGSAGAASAAAFGPVTVATGSGGQVPTARNSAQHLAREGSAQHIGGSGGAGCGGTGCGGRDAAGAAVQASQVTAGPGAARDGTSGAAHGQAGGSEAGTAAPPPASLPRVLSAPPPAQLPCWARMMPSGGAEALAAVRRTTQVGPADIAAEFKSFAQTASLELMRCAGCGGRASPLGLHTPRCMQQHAGAAWARALRPGCIHGSALLGHARALKAQQAWPAA